MTVTDWCTSFIKFLDLSDSVTFKINMGTCANKLQVLQYSAVSLETCLPSYYSREQTLYLQQA